MPRTARIAPREYVYHILTRGNNRQDIFKNEKDYRKYIEILQRYKDRYKFKMLSFTPAVGSAKNITYDNNGNLLSMTNSCGTTTYTWDVRNRLAGINGNKIKGSSL
ncbi:MAG: hypothetical protein HZC12_06660 [Nitrospirae bacterium]|nr:hypothetical protein [Nitrospirota bacterium]